MNEKEKFEQLVNWLEGTKETDLEMYREDFKEGVPLTEEDISLIYDEVIATAKAIYEGKEVVEKIVTRL